MKNYDVKKDDCTDGRLRKKLWTEESDYAHHAENLGNYVYADRLGNGNEQSGDGYKYRGRGMIQLTGHDNYEDFEKAHNTRDPDNKKSFLDHPDLLASNQKCAIESAFYYWHSHGINSVADDGTVKAVTEEVNGGSNGLAGRKKRYNAVACMVGATQEL